MQHASRALVGVLSGIVLVVAGCSPSADLEVSRKFQAAQETFDGAATPEEFLRAAMLYQEIRDARFVSGALLYNQGNAFARAGQRGRAIACYREAKRHRPRDPYLDANLHYALGGQAPAAAERSLLEHLLFWQAWVSYAGKFRLVMGGAVVAFVLAVALLYARRRWALQWLCGAAILLTLIFGLSAAYDWYRYDWLEHGVIIRDEVVARKGNGESYEPAFTQPLDEGAEFQVVEHRGAWLLVRLAGAQEGWVPLDAVVVY